MELIEGTTGTTRRDVLKTGGGLALALVGLGLGARSGPVVWAQATPDASPAAGGRGGLEGGYAVIRLREVLVGQDTAAVMRTIGAGFVPLVRAIPGFVAYLGIADPASPRTAFIGVFADKVGADESTRIGAAWLTDNGYAFFDGDPAIAEGTVAIAAGRLGGETGATPATATGATPVAGNLDGRYATVRLRKLVPDTTGEDLIDLIRDGFVPLLRAIPGFVAYLAIVNPVTLDQVGINVFADKAGADESTRVAAEWGQRGASSLVVGDPEVVEGVIETDATGTM